MIDAIHYCGRSAYARCVEYALEQHRLCLGEGRYGPANALLCGQAYDAQRRICEQSVGCLQGWRCMTDTTYPMLSHCCPSGWDACGGECRYPCDGRMDRDSATCDCKCSPEFPTDCGGQCVDLVSDPRNCGRCGWDCGPCSECAGGKCQQGCTDVCRPSCSANPGDLVPRCQYGCQSGYKCCPTGPPWNTYNCCPIDMDCCPTGCCNRL